MNATPAQERSEPDDVVWRVIVFRENDGRLAAEFTSGDYKIGGMGGYSSTPVGALAELCSTLIKMDEDEAFSRRQPPDEPSDPPREEPSDRAVDDSYPYRALAEAVIPTTDAGGGEANKAVSLLLNRLVLASIAKGRNEDVPPEDRITDADIEAIEQKILDLFAPPRAEPSPTREAWRPIETHDGSIRPVLIGWPSKIAVDGFDMRFAYFTGREWTNGQANFYKPTVWMPRPDPPRPSRDGEG